MGPAFGPDDVHGCLILGPLDRDASLRAALREGAAGPGGGVIRPPVPAPGGGQAGGGDDVAVEALVAAGDPLAVRLLGELREAQPALALLGDAVLTRAQLLAVPLNLTCFGIVRRVATPRDAGGSPRDPRAVRLGLAESLVTAARPRVDALLRALGEAEPSALCRAVDRLAHGPRPERHIVAVSLLPHIAPGCEADRSLIRFTAERCWAVRRRSSCRGRARRPGPRSAGSAVSSAHCGRPRYRRRAARAGPVRGRPWPAGRGRTAGGGAAGLLASRVTSPMRAEEQARGKV
jgi:hypothetical protein